MLKHIYVDRDGIEQGFMRYNMCLLAALFIAMMACVTN
jgi:hypothetical protein